MIHQTMYNFSNIIESKQYLTVKKRLITINHMNNSGRTLRTLRDV